MDSRIYEGDDGRHRQSVGLIDLDPAPHFDLVIIDEVHHIRNGSLDKEKAYAYKCTKYFCDHADAVVMLTATPLQTGDDDLFILLNVLRPDIVMDKATFNLMSKPNEFISQASHIVRGAAEGWQENAIETLKAVTTTQWGENVIALNPLYQSILSKLAQDDISREERVQLITDIESLHSFDGMSIDALKQLSDHVLELADNLPNEDENAIDILPFTEVGSEGLDYQFCNLMINYDLPWNPMRIEQRIGRIDRRGQTSDVVNIYNMITKGTVDADIYERCLMRIGVFERSIGECEAILGQISTEVEKIALNTKLTDEERRFKLEQMADNEVRRIQEMNRLEDEEKGLFGFDLSNYTMTKEIQTAESPWLTPRSLQYLVERYLNDRLGKANRIVGESEIKTLRLSASDPFTVKKIYLSMVRQYVKRDAALNQNPILFLNKLTHLKMYFDGFRYIEFDVERKEPKMLGDIALENNVIVSVDMKDYENGIDRAYSSVIECKRYTQPIIYGEKECKSRYGEDATFTERRHNLIALFPMSFDDLKDYKGLMYSFLPTQIQITVLIVLHVPFKLDRSRQFVDPQNENRWFTYTIDNLESFLKKIYVHLASEIKQDIVTYIPNRHNFFFKKTNEKIQCLLRNGLKGDEICKQKVFYVTDSTYESADNIVAFAETEELENPVEVFAFLGENTKLFIPNYSINMQWYNVQVISNVAAL